MDPAPTSATSGTTAATPGFAPSPFPAAPFTTHSIAAGALLAALAVVALVMARRKRRAPRLIEIVESVSLGPKRSLVVARMGGELLVLGSSEAGITLLSSRPGRISATTEASASGASGRASTGPGRTEDRREPVTASGRRDGDSSAPRRDVKPLLHRLRLARPPAIPPDPFDAMLAESFEDVELRRKLAAGQAASVR